MKILKPGKIIAAEKKERYFKCPRCGCAFSATEDECTIVSHYNSILVNCPWCNYCIDEDLIK